MILNEYEQFHTDTGLGAINLEESHFVTDAAYNETNIDNLIGNMLIMGFVGKAAHELNVEKVLSYLKNGLLGGVILYRYNIDSPEQLKELTSAIKEASPNAFIAVDQEGGRVQRLTKEKGFTGFPSAYEVGTTLTLEEASSLYQNMASELYNNGVNLNFAPVVDIASTENPCPVIGGLNRSFSDNVDNIVNYTTTCIDSHHANKVFTAIKHFPGHGLAKGDTHLGMVDVTETAREFELEPFYKLIEQNKTDMVMTAHVINQHIDQDKPITLSPVALKQLLRDKGYDGVIVTDDLLMGAIMKHYGFEEAIELAINAGNDLLIVSNNKLACKDVEGCEANHDAPTKVIEIVKDAINKGRISKERIQASNERINKLKAKFS
jgi:beta-N-acetylhexosaminidase